MSSARSFGRCREPVQTEPKDVVGFLGPLDDLLQLVEDVAMQVAEQHPVDVQRVVADEPGGGEQDEDVFQWPQHFGGRCPSGVANGRVTSSGTTFGWARANWREVVGDGAQLDGPVRVGGVHQ